MRGLSEDEASRIRARVGPNALPETPSPSLASRVLSQLRDPMILLLLAAAALTVAIRDPTDFAVITAVVVLNTAVGVAQEVRAEHALAALRAISAPTCTVVRDGRPMARPASHIVPGDLVILHAGDIVPADGHVQEATELALDEAALTGESQPVEKTTGADVMAGCVVTDGMGTMSVTAIGSESALGRIATLVEAGRAPLTPLQLRLRGLGRVLAGVAVAVSAVVLVVGLLRGRSFDEMVLTAVSLAVAAVPESLPAVVTLALALGARRMAMSAAIVRGLPAVETLGSVTVLATDKTGTLTAGRMAVERVRFGEAAATEYVVTHLEAVNESGPGWQRLLRDIVLCNDAEVMQPDDRHDDEWVRGRATDAALLQFALAQSTNPVEVRADHPRVGALPFNSRRGRMTTIHAVRDEVATQRYLVVCKGAPDILCDIVETSGTKGTDSWSDAAGAMAEEGLRVLAVADAVSERAPDLHDAETGLTMVGLLGITDPPRPGAGDALRALQEAGIRVVMVTGDHPETARAVAARIGLVVEQVSTGSDLEADGVPRELSSIFARTQPEQKLDIVQAVRSRGHVVAVTGDGVNDAPALRAADIGVAMGGTGTEVAKQAADLVLTDDSLATLATAVAEGRRVYANIRRFLRYGLAGGFAEILTMLVGPLIGLAVPLLPAQILWVNLVTHGLPGVAFGAEPGDEQAMTRPPRPPDESVLGHGLGGQVVGVGSCIALVSLAAGWWQGQLGGPAQSTLFLTLGLAQLGVAVALRRNRSRPPYLGFLDVAVLAAVTMQLAAVYVPALRDLLGTAVVDPTTLLWLIPLAALPGGLLALTRRSRDASRTSSTSRMGAHDRLD